MVLVKKSSGTSSNGSGSGGGGGIGSRSGGEGAGLFISIISIPTVLNTAKMPWHSCKPRVPSTRGSMACFVDCG